MTCLATLEEKPSCLVKRWTVARHEDEASGDPDETFESAVAPAGLVWTATEQEVLPKGPKDPGTSLSAAKRGATRVNTRLFEVPTLVSTTHTTAKGGNAYASR